MLARLRRFVPGFIGDQSGATMVEMTLLAPFLIVLSAGVFEFANYFHDRHLVQAGVRDAARYYARCRRSDATAAACAAAAQQIAVFGAGGTARVTGWTTDDVTVAIDKTIAVTVDEDGNVNHRSQYPNVLVVEVSTAIDYTGVGFVAFLGIGGIEISGAHQERVLGW